MNTAYIAAGDNFSNTQLLYFTSSSLSSDDKYLFTISDRSGSPNIWVKNLETQEQKQLTDNKAGYMKSYVYFDGDYASGLGKASISLDPYRKIVYYIQDNKIMCADISGNIRHLADIPSGEITAFTHISKDGKRLCVPTVDGRAFEYDKSELNNNMPPYDIDRRVNDEGLSSYLRVYNTETGAQLSCEPVKNAWITHVQFCPSDSSLILYNHEWPVFDMGARRMWLFDGSRHIQLRPHSEATHKDDWTCHEMWSSDGRSIIYHGHFRDKTAYIGRVNIADMQCTEIPLNPEFKSYGHFTISHEGRLVSDGYYQTSPDDAAYISVQDADWEHKTVKWTPLCKHESSWKSQDAHPHPIYNNAGDKVYFTSDKDGTLKVYSVNVK